MKYRAEIDGLRAIAVLPVILFHAGFHFFSGGFVGVDVFFVISGYLITTIILTEMEQQSFSIVNFYERRARRILPVLFVIMMLCIPFAYYLLLPTDMDDFSQSLVAVSFFSSNILFWQESGYWGAANELKPLLHTWSLAVEEQFYLFFPVFLIFMWRFPKRWILGSFLMIAVISFLLSEWAVHNSPTANFFLLPTRLWELGIGASIAFYFLYRKKTVHDLLEHKILKEVGGLLGLSMILFSVFFYSESTPFPSSYALVPTIGTGLIILFSSTGTIAGKILANRFLVGIGLVSYSAYLWHQPLFAFARHASPLKSEQYVFVLLIIATFVLSYLSWRFIEAPFRNKKKFSRTNIFSFALAGSIFFITFGLYGHYTNGFDSRKTATGIPLIKFSNALRTNSGLSKDCTLENLSDKCQIGKEPEVLLWGDSHAQHLATGLKSSATNRDFIQITMSSCRPFIGLAILGKITPDALDRTQSWAINCVENNDKVLAWLASKESIEYVILASPYSFTPYVYYEGDVVKTADDVVIKAFLKTINEIRKLGKKPIVISPVPNNGSDIGRCSARALILNKDAGMCDFSTSDFSEYTKSSYHTTDLVKGIAPVFNLKGFICKDKQCDVIIDNIILYRDIGHLTKDGSIYIGREYDLMGQIIKSADNYWK
jgi:peptidoglycan/LPS O-acetylase OafA/YrhL